MVQTVEEPSRPPPAGTIGEVLVPQEQNGSSDIEAGATVSAQPSQAGGIFVRVWNDKIEPALKRCNVSV